VCHHSANRNVILNHTRQAQNCTTYILSCYSKCEIGCFYAGEIKHYSHSGRDALQSGVNLQKFRSDLPPASVLPTLRLVTKLHQATRRRTLQDVLRDMSDRCFKTDPVIGYLLSMCSSLRVGMIVLGVGGASYRCVTWWWEQNNNNNNNNNIYKLQMAVGYLNWCWK
jgi:hypothetical protein